MPMKPPTLCEGFGPHSDNGIAATGNLCSACRARRHEDRVESDASRRYESPHRHLYKLPAWERLRQSILSRDPICKLCGRAASAAVDHIKDHNGNMTLFFDPKNLRGVCKSCHDSKTAKEHGFGTMSKVAAPMSEPQVKHICGVAVPVAGSLAVEQPLDKRQVVGSNPAPPTTFPVAPQHANLPDGTEACKAEYNRFYVKRGDLWHLRPLNG
jgi:5-methylcytosine-specific restriction enzyme A